MLEQAPSWREVLAPEFEKPYMQELYGFLEKRRTEGAVIYPDYDLWFHALEMTPLNQVKVVILGQDPYHQPGQAQGLSFSVKPGVKVPPSLRNIYNELATDVGFKVPNHGSLESWAKQGVLLLNAVLTVEDSAANAHQGRGWEQFTDKIIELVNERCTHCVFILWGSYAQKKGVMVDQERHLVISSVHPSPLSAHRGFLGSQPFSKVNQWLVSQGQTAIDWQLPIETSDPNALIQTTLDLTHTEAEG